MKNHEHDNFTIGDEVMCPADHGPWKRAVVRKVTGSTVTVDVGGGRTETYRRHKYGRPFACRKRTEEDQREEDFERSLTEWQRAAPTCKGIRIRFGGWSRTRVEIDAAAESTEDFAAIMIGMNAIGEWLARRPAEPTP